MNLTLPAAALLTLLASDLLAAENPMAAYEAECMKYAKEDGVAAEDMEGYISLCVQDMAANPGEGAPVEEQAPKEGVSKE